MKYVAWKFEESKKIVNRNIKTYKWYYFVVYLSVKPQYVLPRNKLLRV